MGEGLKITLVLMSIVFLSHIYWTWGQEILKNHYTSTYGQVCYDACSMHDNDYYWCNTRKGWDYCSVQENTDYKGNECRDDHPCEKYDKDYYWCWNKAGGRGYCGKVEPKTLQHISSTYQSVCRDECLNDDKGSYYWCYTDNGWDYCSPLLDATYKNEPCQTGHHCDSHGQTYTWCYTDSDWDYCGLIRSNECMYINSQSGTSSDDKMVICTRIDNGNGKVTTFYAEPNSQVIADGTHWKKQIRKLISRWNNNYLRSQPKSGLITSDDLRIDLQGLTPSHYNLQIQVNRPRQPKESTTVAQVLIPQKEYIPDRYVRMAFEESFRHRAKITVNVSRSKSFILT